MLHSEFMCIELHLCMCLLDLVKYNQSDFHETSLVVHEFDLQWQSMCLSSLLR